MSTLNWSDLIKDAGEASSYEPLPDGDYDLSVAEATAKVTQSGKTMFSIKAQVESGAFAKRLVWDNLTISPENSTALGIFFRKMASLGLGREYFDTNPTNAQIESAMVGRRFRAQIGTKIYQGNKRNELKNYYPATAPAGSVPPVPAAAAPAAAPAPAPAPAAAPSFDAAPAAAPAAPF
jgi:hypothetical protein